MLDLVKDLASVCQKPTTSPLTTGKHVIWLPSEASHSLFLPASFFHSLSSQNSTVEQNVRPQSGKRQDVLASRLGFEAAQHPAVNQRASLCSALMMAAKTTKPTAEFGESRRSQIKPGE